MVYLIRFIYIYIYIYIVEEGLDGHGLLLLRVSRVMRSSDIYIMYVCILKFMFQHKVMTLEKVMIGHGQTDLPVGSKVVQSECGMHREVGAKKKSWRK